jgi:hypothetical protein
MKDEGSIRILFTGDLAYDGDELEVATGRREYGGLENHLQEIKADIGEPDLLIVNLEGPIGKGGDPKSKTAAILRSDRSVVKWLQGFPHVVCNLANNHIMDFGVPTFEHTLNALKQAELHTVGAGLTSSLAAEPLQIEIKGIRLAILAFTTDEEHVGSILARDAEPGASALPSAEVLANRVAELSRSADAVVVILHWGREYFEYPTPEQVRVTRALIKAGARLVIGHHPHVQQGFDADEKYLACYSIGNFLLPPQRSANGRLQFRKPSSRRFMLVETCISKREIKSYRFLSGFWDKRFRLIPYRGKRALAFESGLRDLSFPPRRDDYEEFWTEYSSARRAELRREELFDVLRKAFSREWRTNLKSLSFEDLRRNTNRLRKLAGMLRKGL